MPVAQASHSASQPSASMWTQGPGPSLFDSDANLGGVRLQLNTSDQINTESGHWHHHHSAAAGDTESDSQVAISRPISRPGPSRLHSTGDADLFADKLSVSQLLLQNPHRFSFLESSDTDEGDTRAGRSTLGARMAACHGHAAAAGPRAAAAAAVASPAAGPTPPATAHGRSHSAIDPQTRQRQQQPPPLPLPPLPRTPPPPPAPLEAKSCATARTRYFFVSTFIKNLRTSPAREEVVDIPAESVAPLVADIEDSASPATVQQPRCLLFKCFEPVRCLQARSCFQGRLSSETEGPTTSVGDSEQLQPPPTPQSFISARSPTPAKAAGCCGICGRSAGPGRPRPHAGCDRGRQQPQRSAQPEEAEEADTTATPPEARSSLSRRKNRQNRRQIYRHQQQNNLLNHPQCHQRRHQASHRQNRRLHQFGEGQRESSGQLGPGRSSVLRSVSRHLHCFFCPGGIACDGSTGDGDGLLTASVQCAETLEPWLTAVDMSSAPRWRTATARCLTEPSTSSGRRATLRARCSDAARTIQAEPTSCNFSCSTVDSADGDDGGFRQRQQLRRRSAQWRRGGSPDTNNSLRLGRYSHSRLQCVGASASDTSSTATPSSVLGPGEEEEVAGAAEIQSGGFGSLLRTLDRAAPELAARPDGIHSGWSSSPATASHRTVVPRSHRPPPQQLPPSLPQPERERVRRRRRGSPSCAESNYCRFQICEVTCEMDSEGLDGDEEEDWHGGGNQSNVMAGDIQCGYEICNAAGYRGGEDAADQNASLELLSVSLISGNVACWQEPSHNPGESDIIDSVTECLATLSQNLQFCLHQIRSTVDELHKYAASSD